MIAEYRSNHCEQSQIASGTRDVVLQHKHDSEITCIGFNDSGTLLASGSADYTIKLWDVATRTVVNTLRGVSSAINSIIFDDKRGRIFAVCEDASVHSWLLNDTGRPESLALKSYKDLSDRVKDLEDMVSRYFSAEKCRNTIALDPAGASLITSAALDTASALAIRDPQTLEVRRFLSQRTARSISISKDGRLMACGHVFGDSITIWSLPEGRKIHSFSCGFRQVQRSFDPQDTKHDEAPILLAFLPNSRDRFIAASQSDKMVKIFGASGDPGIHDLVSSDQAVSSISVSPDGRLLLTAGSLNFEVWDIERRQLVKTMPKSEFTLGLSAFSPAGDIAALVDRDRVFLVSLINFEEIGEIGQFQRMTINEILPGNHGQIAVKASREHQAALSVWDLGAARLRLTFSKNFHEGHIKQIAATENGLIRVILEERKKFTVYTSADDFTQPAYLPYHRRVLTESKLSGDGCHLAVIDPAEPVAIFQLKDDFRKPTYLSKLADAEDSRKLFCFSETAPVAAIVCSDNSIEIWDYGQAKLIKRIGPMQEKISRVELYNTKLFAYGPTGRFGLGSAEIIEFAKPAKPRLMPFSSNSIVSPNAEWTVMNGIEKIILAKITEIREQRINALDVVTLTVFDDPAIQFRSHCFSPKSRILAASCSDGTLVLWNVVGTFKAGIQNNNVLHGLSYPHVRALRAHETTVNALAFSPDGTTLYSGDDNGMINIWDVAKGTLKASLIWIDTDDYMVVTPDNYYTVSRDRLDGIAFRQGNRAFPVYQFDALYNRPDIVMERLGFASQEDITLRKEIAEKRRDTIRANADSPLSLPQLEIVDAERHVQSFQRHVRLRVEACDPIQSLRAIRVSVNGVPIRDALKTEFRPETNNEWDGEIEVELADSLNVIQISALNSQGLESLRQTVRVMYLGEKQPRHLHVLAIGVSRYPVNSSFPPLRYAAADADSIVEVFRHLEGRIYDRVHLHKLIDKHVTRDAIIQRLSALRYSRVNDQVVVALSGHGVSIGAEWYFGTYNADMARREETAISFDELEALLEAIPAREKIMMIDACYAGEPADNSDSVVQTENSDQNSGPPSSTEDRPKSIPALPLRSPERRVLEDIQEQLFANIHNNSGTVVIAAARGTEQAFEKLTTGNGVFTEVFLRALSFKGAYRRGDRNRDGILRISELRRFVQQEVPRLTGGVQNPTMRREVPFVDFRVY